MPIKKYLFILFLLIINHVLCGQSAIYPAAKVKKLTTENPEKEGQVYITYRIIDSSKITIYLINRSNKNISFYGYHGVLRFKKEAKGTFEKWGAIDVPRPGCATGYGNYYVPPKSFVWQTLSITDLNDGDFETEIRFYCSVEGHTIYSNPMPAKINPTRFDNDLLLSRFLKEVHHYIAEKKYRNAIALCKKTLNDYPTSSEARYLLGKAIASSIHQFENLSDVKRHGLLSKAIDIWKEIPEDNIRYDNTVEMINVYSDYLPSREEWAKVDKSECKLVNDKYQCKIDIYFNEMVNIRFRD